MKDLLRAALDGVLDTLRADGTLVIDAVPEYSIEVPKQAAHGDLSTNVAMLLAKPCKRAPREIAEAIVAVLAGLDVVARTDVAGPGFINFVLSDSAVFETVGRILGAGEAYGTNASGAGRRVQVEFVSANPTGPLHIGHGRGAAFGSVVANLFEACGYDVSREYYVNDAGRQMDILALSVWLRYLELSGREVAFPAEAYQGAYVERIAADVRAKHGDTLLGEPPEPTGDDAEKRLDAMIETVRGTLGAAPYAALRDAAKDTILGEIREDLAAFGVRFDTWFSEASLTEGARIDEALAALEAAGHLYEADGARWFRSSVFGDEKDRVVVRENGAKTYFASDIAYHQDKFARGFDVVLDVWGADHHGYIPRVRAALEALGIEPGRLEVMLVQFATLLRGGEKVSMSTRSGEFVTLRELVEEVGVDAARFFYVMRRADQHLEFDLDLATARSNDNPVYYVQYAHARICSVIDQMEERGLSVRDAVEAPERMLVEVPERALAVLSARYPEVVSSACAAREPHQVINYLRELATEFHAYYNAHKMLVDDEALRSARITLVRAVRQVLRNGLGLLGITAPSSM